MSHGTDRPRLARRDGDRTRFSAKVERFGTRSNWHGFPEPTVLLTAVRFLDTDEAACDHVWFPVGKTIAALGLEEGDSVEFDARIGGYEKGYVNRREGIDDRTWSHKLNRPTKWSVCARN